MNTVVTALTNATTGIQGQSSSFVTGVGPELIGATALFAALALGIKYLGRTIKRG